jgi:hypothetical protein
VFGESADSTCFAAGFLASPILLIMIMGMRAWLLIILCADTTFILAGWKEEELFFFRLTNYFMRTMYSSLKRAYLNMYRKPTKEEVDDDIKVD